jgi:hypothetical protein
VAAALYMGSCGMDAFTEQKVRNDDILSLTREVRVEEDQKMTSLSPGKRGARVTVLTKSGQSFSVEVENPLGEPEHPMSDDMLAQKYFDLMRFAQVEDSKAKSIHDMIWNLESKFKELQSLLVEINGNKTKIAESQIRSRGKYPVITQESDRLVAGYTDEENVIDDLPLIVFGDHSCTFKYVDFPFVRGADGTQLLKVDSEIVIPKFLYEYLLTIQLENAGKYERHYKYLKRVKVPIPSITEQQQAVSEIEAYEQKNAEAKAVMAGCAERKKQILEKWLK